MAMGKNLLRKTLISANIFMIILCFYTWNKEKPYPKEIHFSKESENVHPEQVFARKRKVFNFNEKKHLITKVKIFPRGGDEIKLSDSPWEIPATKIYGSVEELNKNQRYIMSNFSYSPGLGNLMFQYASLRSIAEDNKATLILPSNSVLRRAFGNFDSKVTFLQPSALNSYLIKNQKKAKEFNDCCKFHSNISLFLENGQKIEVVNGYFQSFKYFGSKKDFILKQFTFLPMIRDQAQKGLEDAKYKLWDEELNKDSDDQGNDVVVKLPDMFDPEYYFVGIHARHGLDITMHSRNIRHGHTFASIDFYQKAVQHFVKEFHWRKIIFVVAGDDLRWAKKVFSHFTKEKFLFIETGQRESDMATLSFCNATIMSTGTFSWWTAFLTNGPTVYYSGWPRKGSALESMVEKADYFLPSWIPL